MTIPANFMLFYDGQCPICQKEIAWLHYRNKLGKLAFQDINDEAFESKLYAKEFEDFMAEIHGVYADGRLVKGVDAFIAAYTAVGLGYLVAPMGWTLLRPMFDWLYSLFARHRLRLGTWIGKKTCGNDSCRL